MSDTSSTTTESEPAATPAEGDPSDIVRAVVADGKYVRSLGRIWGAGEELSIPRGLASALADAGFVEVAGDEPEPPVSYTFSITGDGTTAVIS